MIIFTDYVIKWFFFFLEYGVHLVEIALNRNGSLILRQLAGVLLKQYVEEHWNTNAEKVFYQKNINKNT